LRFDAAASRATEGRPLKLSAFFSFFLAESPDCAARFFSEKETKKRPGM